MGFLYLAIKIPQLITTAFLMNMVTHLKFMVFGALTHLGLFKSALDDHDDDSINSTSSTAANNYVLILDGSSPSLVPIPVHIVTASIKDKVPVVSYGDFLDQFGGDEEETTVCTVCLDCVERTHPIRQLINCNHVFHRECLDTWVGEGQVTCPLCRSMLLPPKKFLWSCSPAAAAAANGPVANTFSTSILSPNLQSESQ